MLTPRAEAIEEVIFEVSSHYYDMRTANEMRPFFEDLAYSINETLEELVIVYDQPTIGFHHHKGDCE